ncbi:PP2C family serine/threonine-protein phosphatase [soil metagenome]
MAARPIADLCGVSVRGIKHVESGEKNQDALALAVEPIAGIAVAAVSDGHSGALHFRSDVGATIAVETAVEAFADLIPELTGAGFDQRERLATHGFASRLFGMWSQRVMAHLERHPIAAADRDRIAAAGPGALRLLHDHPSMAYGATLLAVASGPGYCVAVQLGDGEIVGDTPRGLQRLLPAQRQQGPGPVRTATIAALAHEDLRLRILENDDLPHRLMLCSDGFSEAFKSEAAFMAAAGELLSCAGPSTDVNREARLEAMLRQVSLHGSQDDVTVALVGDVSLSQPCDPLTFDAMLGNWMPNLLRTPGADRKRRFSWLRRSR